MANAAIALLAYLLVMAPWFARNLVTFGSVQPPGGLSTLWLVDYNDLFLYPPNLTPTRFFGAGLPAILQTRWQALLGNLATFVGVLSLVFLAPFTLIGAWRRWRDPWLLPAVIYGAALFAAMTLAFALPGVRGGWFHSGAALLPFVMVAGITGLDDAVRWVARRRARWNAAVAQRVFGGAAVAFAVALTGWLLLGTIIGLPISGRIAWNEQNAVYGQIGAALNAMGVSPEAPVMVNNPPGFYWHSGHGGIPLPSGDESMLLRAADDYGITYLVVDPNVAPPLFTLYLDGPASERLLLLEMFGSGEQPVYLYRILPAP